jgi:hypothetical protein
MRITLEGAHRVEAVPELSTSSAPVQADRLLPGQNRNGTPVFHAKTIVRLAVWLWSVGWLSYGASAFSNGHVLGVCLSVCCFAAAVAFDCLLEDWADAKTARPRHSASSTGTSGGQTRVREGAAGRFPFCA